MTLTFSSTLVLFLSFLLPTLVLSSRLVRFSSGLVATETRFPGARRFPPACMTYQFRVGKIKKFLQFKFVLETMELQSKLKVLVNEISQHGILIKTSLINISMESCAAWRQALERKEKRNKEIYNLKIKLQRKIKLLLLGKHE